MAENGVLWLIIVAMAHVECRIFASWIRSQHSSSTRPALDQRKRICRGSLENLEHTSSKLATAPQLVNKIINSLTHSTIMGTTYKK